MAQSTPDGEDGILTRAGQKKKKIHDFLLAVVLHAAQLFDRVGWHKGKLTAPARTVSPTRRFYLNAYDPIKYTAVIVQMQLNRAHAGHSAFPFVLSLA